MRAGWRAALFVALIEILINAGILLMYFVGRPKSSALAQVVSYLVVLAAAWLAHYIMLRWVDRKPWSYVGLGREQLTPRAIAIGLALGALCIMVPSGGLLLGHQLSVTTGLQGTHSWIGIAAAGTALFLPQSLGEEMLSRGYLFAALRDGIGAASALAITSIGFGLLHMANPGANAQSVIIVILAGVFLGAILTATRSLYAAWAAHFAWNWTMAELLHSAVSGIQMPYSTYRVISTGPAWLTGGLWGPEGGAAAAAGMLAGIAVMAAWYQRLAPADANRTETVA